MVHGIGQHGFFREEYLQLEGEDHVDWKCVKMSKNLNAS